MIFSITIDGKVVYQHRSRMMCIKWLAENGYNGQHELISEEFDKDIDYKSVDDYSVTRLVASEVLGYFNEEGGFGYLGSFKKALYDLMCLADSSNFGTLRNSFLPDGEAIALYKFDKDGLEILKAHAQYGR